MTQFELIALWLALFTFGAVWFAICCGRVGR